MAGLLRAACAGMALGGILFFTRMAPVFAVLPEDMPFPPETTADLIRLAEAAEGLWQLSHAMGLIAVFLFIIGYWAHASALSEAGHKLIGKIAASVATLAFGLFSVALIIDGFQVPAAAEAFRADAPGMTEASVQAAHERALSFFTPGVFLMFIAMGILSSRLLHGFIHSRWLGAIGMLIAILGPTAYLFGWTGPNWDNLQIGGSLMMLAFLWHLLIGIVALFGRGVRTST